MNDADTRIKDLINSAVDLELADHCSAPPLDRSRLAERSPSTSPVALWSVPVLAASVAALLAVGAILAINHDLDRRSNPPGNSASPTPSMSKSTDPKSSLAWCPRSGPVRPTPTTYAEAAPGAPEATEVAGVSVSSTDQDIGSPVYPGPVDAYLETSTYPVSNAYPVVEISGYPGRFSRDFPDLKPVPGKSYPFTLKYTVPENGDPVSALSIVLQDVAAGSCPKPFLVRPNHTYLIRGEVTFRPDAAGRLLFTELYPNGAVATVLPLSGPARDPAKPEPTRPQPQAAQARARAYLEAVAGAREATEVAGVSVSLTGQNASVTGLSRVGPFSDLYYAKVVPGKSYPFTVKYVMDPSEDITVVSVLLQHVASGSCPEPFLMRPHQTYLIHCQVTFGATTAGQVTVDYHSPTRHGSFTSKLLEAARGS
ncbi:MAG: hypothetical protein ABIQ09_18890 [Jatrophihabitantaceae bacterium]